MERFGPQSVDMTLSLGHTGGGRLQNVAHKLSRGVYIKPAVYHEVFNEGWNKPEAVCIVGNPGLGKTAMAIELHNHCLQVRPQLRLVIVV